jgi:hypothetical protein
MSISAAQIGRQNFRIVDQGRRVTRMNNLAIPQNMRGSRDRSRENRETGRSYFFGRND